MAEKQKHLAAVVHVDGKAYGPGPVSQRIAKKITNPKARVEVEYEPTPAPPAPPADECSPECAETNHEGVEHAEYVEQAAAPDAEQS
jgi:hypothetical protein